MDNIKKVIISLIICLVIMFVTVVLPAYGAYKVEEPYMDEKTQIDTETSFYGTVLHSLNIVKQAPDVSNELNKLNDEYERIIIYKVTTMLNLYIVPAICFVLSLIVIGFILLKNEKITNVVSYAIMFSGVVSIISYISQYIMINHVVHM